jgi:hypothetical protein
MSVTRAEIEQELINRQKGRLEAVEMSVTANGANTDLNGSIAYALRQCGGSMVSLLSVSNTDLLAIDAGNLDKFLDIAELRILKTIKGRWAKVDIKVGQLSENLSQFASDLQEDIARLESNIEREYGLGTSRLYVGSIDLNFSARSDDEDDD